MPRKPNAAKAGPDDNRAVAEVAVLEGKGNRLSPYELGLLSKNLAAASNPVEAVPVQERLVRGFYGI
jgi:hypothetical protein